MPLELGNINLGQLVQAATMPPAIQFMQGLAQLPDTFAKAEYDAGQAQKTRLDAQSLKMQIAKNQWDQTVAMIQKNPDLASSQSIIHKMQSLTGDTGYTLPLTKGGTSIDQSVWGADFNEFMKDKDFQERWWATDERGRRAMASAMHLTGVSKEAFTAHPVLTTGEQVLQGKLKVAVNNEKRLENLTDSQIGLNTAKAAGIRANIDLSSGAARRRAQKAQRAGLGGQVQDGGTGKAHRQARSQCAGHRQNQRLAAPVERLPARRADCGRRHRQDAGRRLRRGRRRQRAHRTAGRPRQFQQDPRHGQDAGHGLPTYARAKTERQPRARGVGSVRQVGDGANCGADRRRTGSAVG